MSLELLEKVKVCTSMEELFNLAAEEDIPVEYIREALREMKTEGKIEDCDLDAVSGGGSKAAAQVEIFKWILAGI